MREELMWKLPVADMCILDKSPFVEGLDMENYWQSVEYSSSRSRIRNHEVYSEKWGKSQYTKQSCYMQAVRCIVFREDRYHHPMYVTIADQQFWVPRQSGMFTSLFAVRKLITKGHAAQYI